MTKSVPPFSTLGAYVRPNPFTAIVEPPRPRARWIQDEVLKLWWRREDARYARRGHVAPWHPRWRDSLAPDRDPATFS